MKTLIITFLIITFVRNQTIIVSPQTACTCMQFQNSNTCNNNTLGQCQWSTKNQNCEQAQCSNMTTIQECLIARNRCSWNGNKCIIFESCSKLVAQDSLICPQQNTQCYGLNGTQCQNISSLSQCSTYSQNQCGQQGGYAGSDGLCYYNGTSCTLATACSQLLSEQICNFYLHDACIWQNSTCQQKQCSQLNINTCTFIVQNLNPETVLSCYWSGYQCLNATQQLLSYNQQQCQSNTLLNYRWLQFQYYGICVSCAKQQLIPNNACSCQQYIFETNCIQAQYCQWTGTQCIENSCSTITNQLSCSNNINCYWNISSQSCQIFNNCYYLVGQDSLQCISQSINCPSNQYGQCSPKQLPCSSYYLYMCDGMYGLNGYCYSDFQKGECLTLTSCNQITNQNLCNQLLKICYWNNNICTRYQCSNIVTSAQCTYVAKGLDTTDIQVCFWTGSECNNSINQLTLGENNCSINTAFTYYYSGSMCITCNHIQINFLANQCHCSQLFYYQDCQSNPLCTWTLNNNQYVCTDTNCNFILDQSICVQNPYCQWTKLGCSNFIACPSLIGKNQKECLSQSLNCPSSNGLICQNQYFLKQCETITTSNECLNTIGSDGFCLWNSTNSECGVLSSCSQILNQKYCGNQEYSCQWNNGLCTAISCSTFTSVFKCKFYYQSINSQKPIQCYWNAQSNICNQIGQQMTQLTSSTCYTNTGHTARWSNNSIQTGFCISCSQKLIPNPYQCSCSQIISQINCLQNKLCSWNKNNSTCTVQSCSVLEQSVCVTSHQCMWSGTSCVQFTSCSNIQGNSNDECLSFSLYCPYNKNTKSCGNLQSITNANVSCKDQTQQECQQIRVFGRFICQWNYQINECKSFSNCQLYQQPWYCQDYQDICYWSPEEYQCLNKGCHIYTTKQSCTYVYDLKSTNFIQSCQWVNNKCQNMIGQQFSDIQMCYQNTDGTSRWSSNTSNSGFCIPCGLPIKSKDQCKCSQLLNQNECISKFCKWNGQYCQNQSCSTIYDQFSCIQQKECFWNIQQNYCQHWNIPSNFCQSLTGNNSIECLAQSIQCPISLNGICQSQNYLQTCSNIKNENICTNSIGQEGLCTYENQSCKIITSCTQIKSYNTCFILEHICQWNTENNHCVQLLCQNITEQSQCTYIYQSINSTAIQYCQWNQTSNTCSAANIISTQNKTLQNCYTSTDGTYHWSNTLQNGYCVTCALNQIIMPDTCSCNQLTDLECQLATPRCRLNQSGQCSDMSCNAIFDSMNCSQISSCMWQQGQCITFTQCSDITGITVLDCLAQSKQCLGVSGGKCQSKSDLSQCSSYTQSTCTFGMSASDGLCYFNDTTCTTIKDCSQLNSISLCSSLNKMCKWNYQFGNCVPFKCQDYLGQDICSNIIVNLNNPQIELCQWQNDICQPYNSDYYRYDEQSCYEKSAHTYRWVQDDKRNTRCQICYSLIFFINIFIFIMIQS